MEEDAGGCGVLSSLDHIVRHTSVCRQSRLILTSVFVLCAEVCALVVGEITGGAEGGVKNMLIDELC